MYGLFSACFPFLLFLGLEGKKREKYLDALCKALFHPFSLALIATQAQAHRAAMPASKAMGEICQSHPRLHNIPNSTRICLTSCWHTKPHTTNNIANTVVFADPTLSLLIAFTLSLSLPSHSAAIIWEEREKEK